MEPEMITPREAKRLLDRAIDRTFDEFPSELANRNYNYPKGYPSPANVRRGVMTPLALFAGGMMKDASQADREALAAGYMTRFKAWAFDHPTYLLTKPLVEMLSHTDRLEDPNIDTDCRPPFGGGYFVIPRGLLGLDGGDYVEMVSFAVLTPEDFDSAPHIRGPGDLKSRRFYMQADMASGMGYYAKLKIGGDGSPDGDLPDGVVQNPDDSSFSSDLPALLGDDELFTEPLKGEVSIRYPDEQSLTSGLSNLCLSLFAFLNMEGSGQHVRGSTIDKVVKPKRKGFPHRKYLNPAMIGLGLRPSGDPTHGGHASPHSHIRRGHWRRVHFGPKRGKTKRVWIKPTLVNPDVAGGAV